MCGDFVAQPVFYVYDEQLCYYKLMNRNSVIPLVRGDLMTFMKDTMEELKPKARDIVDLMSLCGKVTMSLGKLTFMMDVVAEVGIMLGKSYDNFANNLDQQTHCLQFKNGLIDLKTGKFRKRTKNDEVKL